MGPDRFEELCAEILEKNRFGRVEMLGCMRAGWGAEWWRAAAAAARSCPDAPAAMTARAAFPALTVGCWGSL